MKNFLNLPKKDVTEMIFDVLELLSLGPILYFILGIFFLVIFLYSHEAWVQGGQGMTLTLLIALGSLIGSAIFFIIGIWHSLEYLDFPFWRKRLKKRNGLIQCRVCYQYKQIEMGNVCSSCFSMVQDNV